jgi:hypothetical protein
MLRSVSNYFLIILLKQVVIMLGRMSRIMPFSQYMCMVHNDVLAVLLWDLQHHNCVANFGFQVEVCGQILGNGVGITWEDAKLQAADEALGMLRSMLGPLAQKRSSSPR